ncbi:hypothetical protein BS47DRAFT_1399099 [Hydnum rufescens UP504]|uniref:Uncharacterized protein n=1 Tax=Hydnum rufescens UP504 TaxID=1448309 RepID=A0A9P6AKA8_9AGAM|nr:hypothetical protein BS47DRAFT_1399099 [Hydnum rufescens UP504]
MPEDAQTHGFDMFLHICSTILDHDTPKELIVNFNQTQVVYSPGMQSTWGNHGAKQAFELCRFSYDALKFNLSYALLTSSAACKALADLCRNNLQQYLKILSVSKEAKVDSAADNKTQEELAYNPDQDPGGPDGCDTLVNVVVAEVMAGNILLDEPTGDLEANGQNDGDDPAIKGNIIPTPQAQSIQSGWICIPNQCYVGWWNHEQDQGEDEHNLNVDDGESEYDESDANANANI